MPRKFEMSWEPSHRRWVKMVQGRRLKVACSALAELYPPLPEHLWTKEGSYLLANRWIAERLGREERPSLIDRQIEWARQNDADLAEELEAKRKAGEEWDGDVRLGVEIAEANGVVVPEDLDPVLKREFFGDAQVWQDRLSRQGRVEREFRLSACVDEFLALLRPQQKPLTHRELQEFMDMVKGWWGDMDVQALNEQKVTDAFTRISKTGVCPATKKKRWGFFKRFVKYLFESGRINLPRNVGSKILRFKAEARAIKTYPADFVRATVQALPDLLRLWALLGLNCGMTNADIGALRQDMVADGFLVRKRVKTAGNENVPTVRYRLWPETLDLLKRHRATSSDLWFVSQSGTPLVTTREVGGKVKAKDLVNLAWKRHRKCPIPVSKFRNVAATTLETHESYGRYVEHFLGHSPRSIKDRHYAAPSQEVFDKAISWLHDACLGPQAAAAPS